MDLTVEDLYGTYIKLAKDTNVFLYPQHGEKNTPVWFTKRKGEIAGKLFSWVDAKKPNYGNAFGKYIYLVFTVNDDINGKNYYIRIEKGMIDWEFTKAELLKKRQANMNLFEKFKDDLELSFEAWKQDVVDNVKSGLFTGGAIAAGILLLKFVIIPEVRFRRTRKMIIDVVKEAKR
jgi:hypothetical protein